MKVSLIGTGYVGLVSGACFAELGHEVICHDIDEVKIEGLKKGVIPIYEPGLEDLVEKNVREERLRFTSNIKEAVEFADIVMSAVGTPPDKDHRADLQYVKEVAEAFAGIMADLALEAQKNGEKSPYKIFVNKSTVPVGTAELCEGIIKRVLDERGAEAGFDVVSNPEFLREGAAIDDTFNPDRIVVGVDSARGKKIMEKLYYPLVSTGKPLLITDIKSAEVIKYASNSFLATKISFINEVANFCEKVGADVNEVSKGMGLDSRIGGKFLNAGIGYGGSCFPKDVKALVQAGKEVEEDFSILEAVDAFNDRQKTLLIRKFDRFFVEQKDLTVAVWGLSFKPQTDDLRFAASVEVIKQLLEKGVRVRAFDPVAMENFAKQHVELTGHDNFEMCEEALLAVKRVDCLLILTEWNEFKGIDMNKVAELMKGRLVLDGRNIYEPESLKAAGLIYWPVGRGKASYKEYVHRGVNPALSALILELENQSQK